MFSAQRNFLSGRAFGELLEAAKTAEFGDVRSPVDGVTYPHICTEIPPIVRAEVEFRAQGPANLMFLRRSPEGVHVPNIVHSDNSMGRTSFMLYLQDAPEPEPDSVQIPGTAFMRHLATGISYVPQIEHLATLMADDANNPEAWVPDAICKMEANKACIFEAGRFHRAQPVGGFGQGEDARCVLTAFFD
ncbi:MAG: hypothetical protein MJA83_15525 [Gammaproteobacteria bacterium]|nr:hypothetical protein [Gammaproteobacteria bacterium]